jgi:hypothetical protein
MDHVHIIEDSSGVRWLNISLAGKVIDKWPVPKGIKVDRFTEYRLSEVNEYIRNIKNAPPLFGGHACPK